jgi:two-component system, chemotaxis family, chemotaxis protein CheY
MLRILIVEDSSAMRSYVRGALEAAPELGDELEIVEASSGFDALRLLPRNTYDLVLTDINMPDINGLELIRFVRQNAHLATVALLVISTQSSERDRARSLALGADEFLAKPFAPEQLAAAVVKCLTARRTRGSTPGEEPPQPSGPVSHTPASGLPVTPASPASVPKPPRPGSS